MRNTQQNNNKRLSLSNNPANDGKPMLNSAPNIKTLAHLLQVKLKPQKLARNDSVNSFGLELHNRKSKQRPTTEHEPPTYAASQSNLNPTTAFLQKSKLARSADKQRKQR
ncbi:hypothetical protein NO559_15240 [Dasania sp. GY-MA-18]|uniref:Uncharacterized protein n=1 Tax=Dasania phycosphaerae TaxID=2950436 RepID=A0A9J6RRC8_9GAMM|nr:MULTISPECIES: hypothetical protein [Dasania]MCR8924138.1 hypothetical protein [Dasania sp. GY-MA-18]MCZ0866711.1 hypothetical protein [Dasania phycosphaerae]MCZ0870296.1 hypothetical protein [Dasania phycosphaerae]